MDELISRQAAIDALLHNQEVYSNNFGDDAIDKYTVAIIDNDAQTIAQLPSAQPERKKGEWIEITDRTMDCCYRCSECGFIRDAYFLEVTNFCPNCGADMRRGKANECI